MTKERISNVRLRNTRAWAAARPDMSGSDVIVGAIDELLEKRALEAAALEFLRTVPDEPPILDGLIALARFRILDHRNGTEEAKNRLLGQMADEVERLRNEIQELGDPRKAGPNCRDVVEPGTECICAADETDDACPVHGRCETCDRPFTENRRGNDGNR